MLTNQTGHYYFNLLSEEEQKQFKENLKFRFAPATFEEVLEQNYIDFSVFISSSFSWDRSNEGMYYWSEISNREFDEDQKESEPNENPPGVKEEKSGTVTIPQMKRFASLYALWIISDGQKYINALSPKFTTDDPMEIFLSKYYNKSTYFKQ